MNFEVNTLTVEALEKVIDLTIAQMQKTYVGIFKDPKYYHNGFAWLLLKRLDNEPLLTFFEEHGTKPLKGICNERVFYHLIKSDAPIIEIVDDNALEYTLSKVLYDTGKSTKWKKQHFWLQFDFKDNNGNSFNDQSLPYKEEVYEFLRGQFKCLGIDAEIETIRS